METTTARKILREGYVLFYRKPFIGRGYCKQYYLCLSDDGYLTWHKCHCLPIKGSILVQNIIDRIRVSRMNPRNIVDCVNVEGMQPPTLWVIHIPMNVKNKMETRSFIVGEQKQLHFWLDALIGTIASIAPSFKMFSWATNNSLFRGSDFNGGQKIILSKINGTYNAYAAVSFMNFAKNNSSDSGINEEVIAMK